MILRRSVIAILSILLWWGAIALAQQTQSSLDAEINTNLPSTNRNVITAAKLRTTLHDMNAASPLTQVNAQTGTSYTFATADYNQLVTFNNVGAVAVTLPQATGSFATFSTFVRNGGAGTVTITPATSTINGAATLTLNQNAFGHIVSDGANYQFVGLGTFPASLFPALTGDVTTPPGSFATTIAAGVVTGAKIASATITDANMVSQTLTGASVAANTLANSKLAQMSANGFKGNNAGASQNVADLTVPQSQALVGALRQVYAISGVNFNSANSDNAITLTPPTGYTTYSIRAVYIYNASASLSTATFGIFSATGGGGTAVMAAGQSITVTSAAANANNNMQLSTPATQNTESFNFGTLQFRVGTAEGSAATASVAIQVDWLF